MNLKAYKARREPDFTDLRKAALVHSVDLPHAVVEYLQALELANAHFVLASEIQSVTDWDIPGGRP